MKCCPTCNTIVTNSKIFCSSACYFSRPVGYSKHSNETRNKIAIGNSKPFTEKRKKSISIARTFVPDQKLLVQLNYYWEKQYLAPAVIRNLCGLSKRPTIYKNLVRDFCKDRQMTFMPSDWYPEDYEKLIELSRQNVYCCEIANILGVGVKQVISISKKLGFVPNTRNPNAYSSVISKPEKTVIEWVKKAGFDVTTQFQLGNFLFDAHVNNTNVLIEHHGDYWHCNPRVYTRGAINDMQKSHQRRDFTKSALAKKMGYYLITVWELDVNQKPDDVRLWILGKIKKHGKRTDIDDEELV